MEPGRQDAATPEAAEVVEQLRAASGIDVAGVYAFGDTPALADELLARVASGTKRATASAAADYIARGRPLPGPGQRWGLLDGAGSPRFVVETVDVRVAPLGTVTPAFAWDEGEDDRTIESWLDAHRAFFARMGYEDVDTLEVVFERFRVVWPAEDGADWLTADVRPLSTDEHAWFRSFYESRWGTTRMVSRGHLHDVADLPGLVCERDGERAGVLTFRPRPEGDTECVTVDALAPGGAVAAALTAGAVALGRRSEWRRLWLVTTNDNTVALHAYQRAGWDLVALHRGSVADARRLKPEIPETGADGIPLHSELEFEIVLTTSAQAAKR